ncbi:MAG: maleylpyruvate isomerase family mycothiol-dependent enzyme [Candidatus Dormibacteria bacterium]
MPDKPNYAGLTAEERRANQEMLSRLTADQWEAPTLCEGWTVRDLAGHLASADDMSLGRFLATLLAAGFSPDKANQAFIDRWTVRSNDDIVAAVGSPALKGLFRVAPAGALTEAFIHGQDIRRPLNISHAHSEESLRAAALATCTTPTGTGSKRRVKGLRLRATDIDWSHGEGPEVTGPAEALVMAANGRAVALADLSGEGRDMLAAR